MQRLLEMIDKALIIGENLGADSVEVYGARNRTSKVRIGSNSIFTGFSIVDEGLGVRVAKDGGLGFAATSLTSDEELETVVKDAVAMADRRKLRFDYNFPTLKQAVEVEGTFDQNIVALSEQEKVELAQEMLEPSQNFDERIKDNAGALGLIDYEIIVANSQGERAVDRGTKIEAALTATAIEGGKTAEGADMRYCRTLDAFSPRDIGEEAARSAVERLKAEKLEEGVYDLIIDPPTGGELCYWFGRYVNPAYADTYYPTLKGREGGQVAGEYISISDDPTFPGGYNSGSIDDEGVAASKTKIVENGILKNFIYDSISASRSGKVTTGNALRTGLWFVISFSLFPGKNYNYEPYPDFSNLVIEPRDWKRDEIIEDTENGLISKFFHYSRVSQHIRGDFTTILGRWSLYRVENGEITGPVGKCRLVDNLFEMLRKTDAIADNLKADSAIVPTIRVRNVNVTPI
mgnify:CR=1 FL=1